MRMIQRTLLSAVAVVGCVGQAYAADPYGVWTRPSTGSKIEFYDCGGKLCAKIASVVDKSKQGTVGKVIMTGAAKSGNDTWKGDLLNVEDGNTYSGTVTLRGASALNLKGCALAGIVCKDETLTR